MYVDICQVTQKTITLKMYKIYQEAKLVISKTIIKVFLKIINTLKIFIFKI